MNGTTLSPPQLATRVRYSILALLCFLAMITYLDRAILGSVKGDMMKAVGQPIENFFIITVAFGIAYALFEVPSGWMGDTFGPRATLLRIVLWWSFFIGLTGFAGYAFGGEVVLIGFVALVVVQILFGAGEAGAFPNITRALYNWFPASQRGSAQGTVWLSARFMGGLTPMIWVALTVFVGLTWRQALWAFAGLAVIWCVVFAYWFRNHPEQHPATNAAERDLIGHGRGEVASHAGVPWRKILGSKNLWYICAMYTVTNFTWYYLMFYFAGDLKEKFPEMQKSDGGKVLVALIGGAPLLLGMFGCLLGGMLTDRYVRRTGDRKWGRRVYAMFGYGLAGVCYLAATFVIRDFWLFAGFVVLVGFFNDFIMGSSWATCQDVGRRYAAIVSGCMNMIGNLGGAVGNLVTGLILDHYKLDKEQGLTVLFTLFAAVYGVGVLLWLKIDAGKPIVADEPAQPAAESV
jgi:ACS family glucarate transporter-like MFS transporter